MQDVGKHLAQEAAFQARALSSRLQELAGRGARAEAMLLRERGWDAVALLITGAPAIAIIASGTVVAVRNHMGGLHIHPYRRGTLNHLYADMRKAEEKVLALIERMKAPAPKNTKETLAPFATELWRLARKAKIEVV